MVYFLLEKYYSKIEARYSMSNSILFSYYDWRSVQIEYSFGNHRGDKVNT